MKPIDPGYRGQEPDDAGAEAAALPSTERRTGAAERRRRKKVVRGAQAAEMAQESTAPEPALDAAEDGRPFRIYAAFAYALIFVVESIDLWLT